MSSSEKKAQTIMRKWFASLNKEDKISKKTLENFVELFELFKSNFIEKEEAYASVVHIVNMYFPNDSMTRMIYSKRSKAHKDISYLEYIRSWKKEVTDIAFEAFFSTYDEDDIKVEKPLSNLPVGMESGEYRRQRKYAESHPLLDIEKIKKSN